MLVLVRLMSMVWAPGALLMALLIVGDLSLQNSVLIIATIYIMGVWMHRTRSLLRARRVPVLWITFSLTVLLISSQGFNLV